MLTPHRGSLTVRVANLPISLHWSFLVLVGFAMMLPQRPWQYGLLFAGVAFVGVLWHELGHAIGFRTIGRPSRVVIHGMGGLTICDDHRPMTDGQAIGISLAGPLAGMVLGLSALLLQQNGVGDSHIWSSVLLSDMVLVNLGWGMVNLIPITPLDGGRVLERTIGHFTPRNGPIITPIVSAVVAVPAAWFAWSLGYVVAAVFAVSFLALNIRIAQEAWQERKLNDADSVAHAATARLHAGQMDDAIAGFEAARLLTLRPATRLAATQNLAWALAWRNRPNDISTLDLLLGELRGRTDTSILHAAAAHSRGQHAESQAALAHAFTNESTPPPAWLFDRLVPDPAASHHLAAWIDQQDLAARHAGLTRLAESLTQRGRTAEAADVLTRLRAPVLMN